MSFSIVVKFVDFEQAVTSAVREILGTQIRIQGRF